MKRKAAPADRPALTRDAILSAAQTLIEADGAAAFTMRKLAAALGVDPMAIYYHILSKEAVISGVIERTFAALTLPPLAGQPWQTRVRTIAALYLQLAITHPVIFLLSLEHEQTLHEALHVTEALIAALHDAGLPPPQIIQTMDLLLSYLTGFALQAAKGNPPYFASIDDMQREADHLPPERFPAIHHLLRVSQPNDFTPDFSVGLSILIAGIEAQRPGGA